MQVSYSSLLCALTYISRHNRPCTYVPTHTAEADQTGRRAVSGLVYCPDCGGTTAFHSRQKHDADISDISAVSITNRTGKLHPACFGLVGKEFTATH